MRQVLKGHVLSAGWKNYECARGVLISKSQLAHSAVHAEFSRRILADDNMRTWNASVADLVDASDGFGLS